MTRLLVSVTSVEEALLALEHDADFIDLKNPSQGALGALPLATIRQIVKVVGGRRPVSATLGDLPMQPELLADRVQETAATGVDIVKVGFFGQTGCVECVHKLAPLATSGVRMIAVLLADQRPDFTLLPLLAQAGFYGVMLDTAGKNGGRLTDHLNLEDLRDFVTAVHANTMLAGLAGSLAASDVAPLVSLGPDYLGFRGALCEKNDRTASLDRRRLEHLHTLLRNYNTLRVTPH